MAFIIVQEEITGTMAHPARLWVVRLIVESLDDMGIMLGYNADKRQMVHFAHALRDELDVLVHIE